MEKDLKADISSDLKINVNDLEKDWTEQASLYMYYSEAYADAIKIRDEDKNKLEIADAQLDFEIRRNWEKHFEKQPAETAIKNWVIMQEKHQKALAIYLESSHNANLLQGAKTALDHKRKALENLVSLLITGFHSAPKVSKHITQGEHLGLKKKTIPRKRTT